MRVIHSVDIAEQNNKIVAKNLLNMKKCQNCGAEMEQDALFCRECGIALTEQKQTLSEKTIPYIDEIIDKHLEHFPNELGKEVETGVLSSINFHVVEFYIISNNETQLRIKVLFKESSKKDKEALERLKKMEYFSLFTTDLTYTEGYCGYADFSDNIGFAKIILSSLFKDVYLLQEKVSPAIDYIIKMGGSSIGHYGIKDGVHVKSKGCLSVIVALVVLGATFFSLM